jgi:hypothetical protein
MVEHSLIEKNIKDLLEPHGMVEVEPIISIDLGSRKYRPDLIFENSLTKKKVIIEVKTNQYSFSLGAVSFLIELKNFLDNNSDYKLVLILTNELTPNISKYIPGRVNYFSLKENDLNAIRDGILKLTE